MPLLTSAALALHSLLATLLSESLNSGFLIGIELTITISIEAGHHFLSSSSLISRV